MPSNEKKTDLFGVEQRPRGGKVWPVHKGSVVGPVHSMPLGSSRRESRARRARIIQHARHYERVTRTPGSRKRNGALGYIALAVLQSLLYDFHSLATGSTFPKQETIATAANISPRSVARALVRLKRAGFLSWTKRARRLVADDGTVEEISGLELVLFQRARKASTRRARARARPAALGARLAAARALHRRRAYPPVQGGGDRLAARAGR